ncbi:MULTISPECIES: S8 family serine peptidase [unclassified Exiguobacterium]|uniref:S8 family peptidase n=1 Tax=Exiguobacterium TaxID=33986 RepID=UPI0020358C74|nr:MULTISPECIES: S8 family serine peptidase [unclassified Exiguobacterium]
MKNKKSNAITCLIATMLLILSGCISHKKAVPSDNGCKEKNWAICSIFLKEIENSDKNRPTKIAILDSGISKQVDSLQKYVVKEYNTLDNSFKTSAQNEHGTMIASIIVSTSFKDTRVGINENVQLYDVQVLDSQADGKIKNTVKGIDWAISQEVDIINMSYGFSYSDLSLKKAIKRAANAGILIIAATGNTFGLSTDYPARYQNVLSISAIDKNKSIYSYAGKGKVDFVAPGVDVPVLNLNGKLKLQSGTSFSTAYATGVISLVINDQDNETIIKRLKEHSEKLGSKNIFGDGLIQFKEE